MLKKALLLSQSSGSNAKPQDMPLFSRFKGTFGELQDVLIIWGTSTRPLGGKFELISGDNLVATRGSKEDTRMIMVGLVSGFTAYCSSNGGDALKVCGVVNETTGYEAFGVYLPYGFSTITVDSIVCIFKKRKEAEDWIAKFANGDKPDLESYITVEPMLTLDDVGKEFIISIYMDA